MLRLIFLEILNTGLTATWLILAILLFRLLFRKAPRWIFCLMWGLVALWLIIPVRIESNLSLLPTARPVSAEAVLGQGSHKADIPVADIPEGEGYVLKGEAIVPESLTDNTASAHAYADGLTENVPYSETGGHAAQSGYMSDNEADTHASAADMAGARTVVAGTSSVRDTLTEGRFVSVFNARTLFGAGSIVWIVGVMVLLGYACISWFMIHRKTAVNLRRESGVYECDEVDSPFILGIITPKIFLPTGLSGEEVANILAHERSHLRRGDHIWKPLGYLLLAIYWFQPLGWIAYILLCRDIEYACDYKATAGMNSALRAEYCRTLLACSTHRRSVVTCPVAFGEVDVKNRVRSVLQHKKPMIALIAAALLAAIVIGICLMTVPGSGKGSAPESDLAQDTLQSESIPGEAISPDEEPVEAEDKMTVLLKTLLSWGEKGGAFAEESDLLSSQYEKPILLSTQLSEDGMTGTLKYYTTDSESGPHVTILREIVELTEEAAENGLAYDLATLETAEYRYIASGIEFEEAYGDEAARAIMDYTTNGLGESLNANALLSSSNAYRDLFAPVSAAKKLLNLLDNDNKVQIREYAYSAMKPVDGALLKIFFAEDGVEKKIRMVQPYGENGIWVPDFEAWGEDTLIPVYEGDPGDSALLIRDPNSMSVAPESAEEISREMFGYPIVLPENTTWIEVDVYNQLSEDQMAISYRDKIIGADCDLYVKKGEIPMSWNGPMDRKLSVDEIKSERWEGMSGDGKLIYVNVQPTVDGRTVLVDWAYEDLQFSIIARPEEEKSDLGPLAKTALHVIHNLGSAE